MPLGGGTSSIGGATVTETAETGTEVVKPETGTAVVKPFITTVPITLDAIPPA